MTGRRILLMDGIAIGAAQMMRMLPAGKAAFSDPMAQISGG